VELALREVLDHERAGCERRRYRLARKRARGEKARARRLAPDRGEMALAAAFGSRQYHRGCGPIRPAIDQGEPGRIRGAAEKILAGKAFRMAERKRKLTRTRAR